MLVTRLTQPQPDYAALSSLRIHTPTGRQLICAGKSRMASREDCGAVAEECSRSGRAGTERLWKKYTTDPSQWWAHREIKANSEFLDLKHTVTKELDSLYSPGWVRDSGQSHDLGLMEECGETGFRPGVKMNASKAQELCDKSDWERLSLEEALTSLERMSQLPSIQNLTCILQKCRTARNLAYTKRLYTFLCKTGLEDHKSLGNYLVPTLIQIGSMCDAQWVFNNLVDRNVYSWTSLISGFIDCGDSKHALNLYQKMQEDSVHPSKYTFVAVLKACARLEDAERGREIHVEVVRTGLERDLFVCNTIVDMYAKCSSLAEAQEAFDRLPVRNEISWNVLIAGYAEQGLGLEALTCFEQMQLEGLSPDAVTFVCTLKACCSTGVINKGREIHTQISRMGLERDIVISSTLVDMYAKHGSLAEAREAFDKLPVRNQVCWTVLIAGYAEHGLGEEALNCFEQMQLEGLSTDAVTFVCTLKACGSIGAIDKGREIHFQISRKGLERNLVVGSTLVDMYAKCGSLVEAQEAFDKLPVRNEILWNVMIAGYAEQGLGKEALDCFKQMQIEGLSPDTATCVCSLKACGSIGAIDNGREIHVHIFRKGLERDLAAGSTLVDMYAKCGSLAEAQEVFDMLPVRDVVSWTALIAGYAEHGLGEKALHCFEKMQQEGLSPHAVTFVCSLKACSIIGAIDKGREIHVKISRKGLERDTVVGSTLVDMYTKCGSLSEAWEVFDKLPVRDEVLWTVLIAGCAEHGLGEEALYCAEQMQLEGISPDAVTFVCSLKACGSIGAIDKAREIHAEIARKGLDRDPVVGSTLADMYAKCGSLAEALEAFDGLPVRNEVLWTSLITGYAEQGFGEKALDCLEQVHLEGLSPDAVTFICSLKACGSIGAVDKGREIYVEISRKGLERDLSVGNTLVDMYAKCCSLSEAQEAFDKLPVQDLVSWNALITGYAQQGESEFVFLMLERMRREGMKPNGVTFSIVLTVCSHTGLLNKGQKYFEAMSKGYGIIPTIEHHIGMVDLLGRAGHLHEAVAMVKKMAFYRNLVVWHMVLGACCKWGNLELGRLAFEHAVQVDEKAAASYVLMSNIYADAHMQEEEKNLEAMRVRKQA